jgi:hypothetical protein
MRISTFVSSIDVTCSTNLFYLCISHPFLCNSAQPTASFVHCACTTYLPYTRVPCSFPTCRDPIFLQYHGPYFIKGEQKHVRKKNLQHQRMSKCEGPCFDRCYRCPFTTLLLSNIAIVYLIASVFYVIFTRSLGTPFMDSLSQEQRKIKKEASAKRGSIFVSGIVIGVVMVMCWKPL